MHAGGILGGENLLPPGFQRQRRRAAALRGNFQRPAEVLARMAKTDTQPVMAANLVIERADIVELLRQ